jgi:transporter family protein
MSRPSRPGISSGGNDRGSRAAFGFTALGLGLVGYVSAIFKLSMVFSVILAFVLLGERATANRVVASVLVVVGALIIVI